MIGCLPQDIVISNERDSGNRGTWNATCHGKVFVCSMIVTRGTESHCTPALEQPSAATPMVATATQTAPNAETEVTEPPLHPIVSPNDDREKCRTTRDVRACHKAGEAQELAQNVGGAAEYYQRACEAGSKPDCMRAELMRKKLGR